MPWKPLPNIAFAIAVYPFTSTSPADLPLELGDELYIIEQGGVNGDWYRGYLVAPPSILSGLTAAQGRSLETRVFSGIFPKNCVEVREVLGDAKEQGNKSRQGSFSHLPNVNNDINNAIGKRLSGGVQKGFGKLDDGRTNSQITVVKLNEEDEKMPSSPQQTKENEISSTHVSNSHERPAKPTATVPMLKIGDETPTSSSEPLVDEIASCLREWHSTHLYKLLLAREYGALERMMSIVTKLDGARTQLLHNVLTAKERRVLREQVVWDLVRGNKMLSGDVIVRDPEEGGQLVTGKDSAVHLARLQSEMSMLDGSVVHKDEVNVARHLVCDFNAVTGSASAAIVCMALVLRSPGGEISFLSETYQMDLPSPEDSSTVINSTSAKTIFTDIASTDFAEGSTVYLVAKLLGSEVARQKLPSISHSPDPSLSRGKPSPGTLKGRRSAMWNGKASKLEGQQGPPPTMESISEDATMGSPGTGSPGTGRTIVLRAVGVGALDVSSILRQNKEEEHAIDFYSPLRGSGESSESTEGFDDVIRFALPSHSGRYVKSSHLTKLTVHVSTLVGSDVDDLVRSNPTSLLHVPQTRRIGFAGAPKNPRSDIYLRLSRATIAPDALLSHPLQGQVPAPTGRMQYLQLTLEVRNSEGTRIKHCIFPSSGSEVGHTAWRTTVAEREASWDQIIRINVPKEEVAGSHIVMSLANAPDFPFALCWLPLWTDNAFIPDGPHSLLLHAYDRTTSAVENGRGAYLSQPWSSLGKNQSAKDEAITGPVATVSISTELCSTEYSQDQVLYDLISWKERKDKDVQGLLEKLVFVPEIEIVKQTRAVLDALFNIVVEFDDNDDIEDIAFKDIITVLGIMHDRRFNLVPLIENYAETEFYFPFATYGLVRSFNRLLQASPDSPQHRTLRAAFKVGQHILKFITKAREQQQEKENDIGVTRVKSTFNRDVHFIFRSIERLMQNQAPVLVGSKTLVVQRFHTWLHELDKALPKEEIIHIAYNFMEACKEVKGMLVLYKLVLISNYLSLPFFSEPKVRKTLQARVLKWIEPYWGDVATAEVTDQYRDQVRLCCSIVAQMVESNPEPSLAAFLPPAVYSYCRIAAEGVEETEYLSLLFSKSFPFHIKPSATSQKFDEALVELSVVVASISCIPNLSIPELEYDALRQFTTQALECLSSVLACESYPKTWLSLHMYHHRTAMQALEYFADIIIGHFLPPPDEADNFDTDLWRLFFTTLLNLASSDSLALESFPEQKRRAVWKIAGDLRQQCARLLHRSWDAIGWDAVANERELYGLAKFGGFQVQYVPSLIPAVLELCLSAHEEVRHVAVEVLRTMIVSEWQLNEDLSMVETEMISSLDALFKAKDLAENGGNKIFIDDLTRSFEAAGLPEDSSYSTAVRKLLGSVDKLLDLLTSVYSGNITESLNTLRLMEFMKDVEKEDIFIQYVHELAQSLLSANNHAEAGLALKFHADLYDWQSTKAVPALRSPYFPDQLSCERKEALYVQMVRHFEEGKAWAQALSCHQELVRYYEDVIVDYAKLAKSYFSMGKIHEAIVKHDKHYPRYFLVKFKGLGFPAYLMNKQYIFEGAPSERMTGFTDRMQKEYPTATIVSSEDPKDREEGQYLQISSVSVYRDLSHPIYQHPKVPIPVREHLLVSNPSKFCVIASRFTSGNKVKEHWVTKTTFQSAEPFPNILRRSEVTETGEVTFTALQTAIERTWNKTKELATLHRRAASGSEANIQPLTEALRQLLDVESPSSTSVALYHQLLPHDDALGINFELDSLMGAPEAKDPNVRALRVAFLDLASTIRRCLSVYNRSAYTHVYNDLNEMFESVFYRELAELEPFRATTAAATAIENDCDESITGVEHPEIGVANVVAAIPVVQNRNNGSTSALSRAMTTESKAESQGSIRQNVGRRSLSLFKFPKHESTNSTATVTKAISNRSKRADTNSTLEHPTNSNEQKLDGETLSHTTSHSKDAKSIRSHRSRISQISPRRSSWFSNSIGIDQAVHANPKTKLSISTPATSMEDVRATQQRITERAARAARAKETARTATPSISSLDPRQENTPSTPFSNGSEFSSPSLSTERFTPSRVGLGLTTMSMNGNDSDPKLVVNKKGSVSNMRDSVMKRFSILKGNKKNSRTNVKELSPGISVNEE